MSQIITVPGSLWDGSQFTEQASTLLHELESGKVLYYPTLRFGLSPAEQALLDPRYADPKRKNISLEPDGQTLRGVAGDAAQTETVRAMMARFQRDARQLIDWLCEPYLGHLRPAPASLRLHRVETRQTSWRKDDSRLHPSRLRQYSSRQRTTRLASR